MTLLRRIDLKDVILLIGLAMVFAGLWFVDWRWALIVVGALLALLAVFGAARSR